VNANTAIVVAMAVLAFTEALGAVHRLDRVHLLICWGAFAVFGSAWLSRSKFLLATKENLRSAGRIVLGESWFERFLNVAIMALCVCTLITALVAPPNTWDAMTYHLGRVVHWQQNRSVDFYPTSISRQLWLAPFAEYCLLHLQVLSGSDRAANLVQWISMVGCALMASMIVARLGADRIGQKTAALVSLTIPEGILEATGTLNDYVAAVWIAAAAYFVLRFLQHSDWRSILGMALALGLGIQTKATTLIFGLPFALLLGFTVLWRWRSRAWAAFGVMALIVVLMNASFYLRVHQCFGRWTGPAEYRLQNEGMGPSLFVSNVLRNLALHITAEMRGTLLDAMERVHNVLGVEINDLRITWGGGDHFYFRRTWGDENRGQNPVHLALLAVALGFVIFRKPPTRWDTFLYALSIVGGFVLFCGLLKWQPWHSRLHLPLFVLGAPLIALLTVRFRSILCHCGLFALVVVSAAVTLIVNTSRPWFGPWCIFVQPRERLYFVEQTPILQAYLETCRFLRALSPASVGLIIESDDWEYPFWVLATDPRNTAGTRWEHVRVRNRSSRFASLSPYREFVPDCIVSSAMEDPPEISLAGRVYQARHSNSLFRVYLAVADKPGAEHQ
jgi:hypothetical protein